MLVEVLALCAAVAFTAIAAYVSLAEHPSRLCLDAGAALAQFKPSFVRAASMQAILIVLGSALGVVAGWRSGDHASFLGAGFLFAVLPYTFTVLMPANRRLLATAPSDVDETTRHDLLLWGRLHAVRNLLGLASTLAFLDAVGTFE